MNKWDVSSGVEHCIHTAGVGSSKLPLPTRIEKASLVLAFVVFGAKKSFSPDIWPNVSQIICHKIAILNGNGVIVATIRQRGKYWEAQVRRTGYPTCSRTFNLKSDARAWAAIIESEMERGFFIDRTEAKKYFWRLD